MTFTAEELRDIDEAIEFHLDECPGAEGAEPSEYAEEQAEIDAFHARLLAILSRIRGGS